VNSCSKHRHHAKDLVQEQKRRNFEKRRLEQEEKEIEREEKQLIRRKQLLLRKNSEPHFKRRFPTFTAGHTQSDSEEEEETGSGDEYDSMDSAQYHREQQSQNEAQMTLKALTSKLSVLENELESIKMVKSQEPSPKKKTVTVSDTENMASLANRLNAVDLNVNDLDDFNMERIEKTLKAAEAKKTGKTVHLTMPSMPSMSSPSLPPQLATKTTVTIPEVAQISSGVESKEDKKVNEALGSLDVSSLMMLLDKMKIYFKEIQIEKKENEEFRSSILTSVNAQNTQILHLLSQLAAQQKEIDELKDTVDTLTNKLTTFQTASASHSGPKWTKSTANTANTESAAVFGTLNTRSTRSTPQSQHHEIALNDIKNAIADSRPSAHRTQQMLQETDWKSISNVLTPKYDTFPNNEPPQNPYTVQRHKVVQKRSFLPSAPVQSSMTMKAILPAKQREDGNDGMAHRVAPPPQPVPKPKPAVSGGAASRFKKQSQRAFVDIQQAMNETVSAPSVISTNTIYPKVIVQRMHK